MKEESKIQLLFNNHLDVDNRIVYLFDEINDKSALSIVKGLNFLDSTEGDIKLIINSGGGSVPAGFAIVDAILKLKNSTTGHVSGCAASMAVDVLQACNRRTMSKFSSIMIHSGSVTVDAEITAAKNQADSMMVDLEMSMDFWMKKIKISKKKLKDMLSTDTFLYSKDALKFGFIDAIV